MIPTIPELTQRNGLGRTRLVSTAVMETLEDNWPRFHYSVVDGEVLLTGGTTVLLTGRTRDDRDTIAATWDYGESVLTAIGRLNNVRKLLEGLSADVAYNLMSNLELSGLPPPQVLITDAIACGMANPVMALGGCAGAAPIAIAVGTERTHLVFDHRLMDPQDEQQFVRDYSKHLAEALGAGPS